MKDSGNIGSVDDICGVFFTSFNELDIEVFYARYICIQQDNKMVKLLKENDLLYISNFSALGDGYKEVEEQWEFLTKTKNVDVVLIDMPLIDTRKGKSAYGPIIADTVLSMLEYVADDENSLRKMRQKEGIALAKERGIIFGRQEKSIPEFQKSL